MNFHSCIIFWFFNLSAAFITDIGGDRICLSQWNEISGFPEEGSYELLKRIFHKNCSHIAGNLILFGLYRNADGTDPDLSFLQTIREISGYLIVMDNNVKEIPLSNLQVIRGLGGGYQIQAGASNASVIIRSNAHKGHYLETLDLQNLQAIQNGDVYIFDNPNDCKLAAAADWTQLLVDSQSQHIFTRSAAGQRGSETWQPLDDVCPKNTSMKNRCRSSHCNWCFFRNGLEVCCDSECLGGCTGTGPNQCFACRNFKDGHTCVHSCPDPASIQNHMLTLNPEFKYRFEGYCVSECPDGQLTEGKHCVSECTAHKFYASGRRCLPCGKTCPKTCVLPSREEMSSTGAPRTGLDARELADLRDCAIVVGDIVINEESFKNSSQDTQPITSASELWALHEVREVTGYIYIDLAGLPTPTNNLTFLENLKKIGGSHSGFSMAILHTTAKFAGLHNFRFAPHGDVLFISAPYLCHIQTLPWIENGINSAILSERAKEKIEATLAIKTMPPIDYRNCGDRDSICHSACDRLYGCWGPRREDCVRCSGMVINGTICVASCTDLPGFYEPNDNAVLTGAHRSNRVNPLTLRLSLAKLAAGNPTNAQALESTGMPKADRSCAACHPECEDSCTGPGADQCIGGCKHAREGNECVAKCSYTSFLDPERRLCVPCQSHCHKRSVTGLPRCTGPGHHPGPGGCNKCEKFLDFSTLEPNEKERSHNGALLCMRGPCPVGTFHTLETIRAGSRLAPYVEAFTIVVPVCRSCHRLCSRCSGYSQLRSTKTTPGCQECNGYWFEDKCVEECPEDATFQVSLAEELKHLEGFSSSKVQLSRRGGLHLRGPTNPRRSVLWTRHIDGVCLACSKQCRKGCWGPSSKQCNQCAHVRVWRVREEEKDQSVKPSEIWIAPSGRFYKLRVNSTEKNAVGEMKGTTGKRDSKSFTVEFECLPDCPESLPFKVFDPLTGEQACYASAPNPTDPESHPVARGGHMNQPRRGLFLGVGAIVFLIMLSVIFVCAVIACAPRVFRPGDATEKAPWIAILRRLMEKLSCLCQRCQIAKTASPYTAASMTPCDQVHYRCCRCEHCQVVCEACVGADCASCRQACPEHFAKHAESEVVFRNAYYHSPAFRRSTRQPNMGRLIMINSDDIVLADNASPMGSGAFGAVYQGVWRMPEEAERLSSAMDSQRSSHSLEPVPSTADMAGFIAASARPRVSTLSTRKLVRVAVKILNENSGPSNLQALLEEAKVMVSVSHPNCLRLLGVCLSGTRRCLVSEYIANGSLDCYLRRYKSGLPNRLLLVWAAQIADGMAYLEATGIIHRDLATRNVLVKRRDLVQITDFGLAKMLSGDEEHGEVIVQSGRVPIRWLAVETLTSGRYSFKTDVWAYGVTLWEIFTFGERPYANIHTADLKRYVLEGGRLTQPDICTLNAYQQLLLSCWRDNPEERSSFVELLHILRSRVDNPEYFLHSRHTSSLMGSSSAAESNDQVATFSSRRLSDLPAGPQREFQNGSSGNNNRSSCPQATDGGVGNPALISSQATERLPRRLFCSTAGTRINNNNNHSLLGSGGGWNSDRRRSQLLRRGDLALTAAANNNNHASARSLSGTEEGETRNWQTLSTSIGSSSGLGTSTDTCAVNTTTITAKTADDGAQEPTGAQGLLYESQEQVETLVETSARGGDTDNEVTVGGGGGVGGYVWPRWPVDFDRETRFGWDQQQPGSDAAAEELPNLSRLVLQRRSQRERLEYQRMLEEAAGRFGAEDLPALPPTTPENVTLLGEYIEPAPRYYMNPSDQ